MPWGMGQQLQWSAPNHWANALEGWDTDWSSPPEQCLPITCKGGCSHAWVPWRFKSHFTIAQ